MAGGEQDKDKVSRWLLAKAAGPLIEALGGVGPIERWRAMPSDLAQPQRVPDSLIDMWRPGERDSDPHVIEVVTYASNEAARQALGDLTLSYSINREVPSVWVLVLRPKGNVSVSQALEVTSDHGQTGLRGWWRVVPLWETPAEVILERDNPYLLPWAPLMRTDLEPHEVFRVCRTKFEGLASERERERLLGATELFAKLRYGKETTIEKERPMGFLAELPIWREIKADSVHAVVVDILRHRLGEPSRELMGQISIYTDQNQLSRLSILASTSADLDAFGAALPAPILFDEYGDPIPDTGPEPTG